MSDTVRPEDHLMIFPSLFVARDVGGLYRFVVSDWTNIGWVEVLESKAGYNTWREAHAAGAEAMVPLVMPKENQGPLTRSAVGDFEDTSVESAFQPIHRVS